MDPELQNELRAMRKETRESIKEVKDETINGTLRLESSVNALRGDFQKHEVVSATRNQQAMDKAQSAHYRIDEIQEDRKSDSGLRWAVWVPVGIAAASGIGSLIFYLLTRTPAQ